MWPFFWLNLVLAVVTIGALVWAVRRIERRSAVALEHLTASLRAELVASIRAELARPAPPGMPPPADEWTPEKNARRCDLIHRQIYETITPAEEAELADLREQAREHVRKVAPLPLDELRQLHDELLRKAEAAATPAVS